MKVAKAEFRVGAAAQKAHDAAEDSEERDAARGDAKRAAKTWLHDGRLIQRLGARGVLDGRQGLDPFEE